ncbi:MAG: Gfo/Idh/MocA family protein, partial [bacterium]
ASSDVELIINLTIPQAHYPVAMRVIQSGKHHYSEKPMGLNSNEVDSILAEAKKHNVQTGCAPDTFMGAGIETAKQAIENGAIGQIVSTMGYCLGRGHESWHPSPEFYYQKGGGPLMDMGPYYLSAMVYMIGNISDVKAINKMTFESRTITSEAKKGTIIPVEVPTHTTALLHFESGAVGTLITSFDSYKTILPNIVIVGTNCSIHVPDTNTFGGDVLLTNDQGESQKLEYVNPYSENSRGLGVANMVEAIENNTHYKANGDLAAHVLKVMEKILEQ